MVSPIELNQEAIDGIGALFNHPRYGPEQDVRPTSTSQGIAAFGALALFEEDRRIPRFEESEDEFAAFVADVRERGAHAHPAALSGIKTQAMHASQNGCGAYNQLVFDDSPGQARIALQRHASAHKGTDELNLGHLQHQTDNQRLHPVGFGAELKTEHSAALRAAQGMLPPVSH